MKKELSILTKENLVNLIGEVMKQRDELQKEIDSFSDPLEGRDHRLDKLEQELSSKILEKDKKIKHLKNYLMGTVLFGGGAAATLVLNYYNLWLGILLWCIVWVVCVSLAYKLKLD